MGNSSAGSAVSSEAQKIVSMPFSGMPQIAVDPFDGLLALARHTPIPTLNSYIIISLLLTIGSAFYAKFTYTKEEIESRLRGINETFRRTDPASALTSSVYVQQFYYVLFHPTLGWVLINTFCALLALIAKLATHATVGKLGAQESVLLRDRICNFLLYKAVFLFGVLNSVVHEEVVAWIIWFALLAAVAALQSIIAYRLKYLISSVPPRRVLYRVMGLAVLLLLISVAFVSFAFTSFRLFSVSIALFILADAIKSLLRSIYVISKCALLLDNVSDCFSSVNLTTVTYYLELVHDLAIDAVDLLHYTHMLLYSQVVLSMACIVISMQLRSFYKSFAARIERHIKYKRICKHIDAHYQKATRNELSSLKDWCAICWEQMDSARKLPCNHFFHEWCLRSWLEQDSSCPTCRLALPSPSNAAAEGERPQAEVIQPFSHVFHFNGARYARWLPSFSVELSHNVGPTFFQRNRLTDLDNSQLNSLAGQVREMFPQLEVAAILEDLRESGSVQATVENILDGRFRQQDAAFELEEEIWTGTDTSSSSDSSAESSGEHEEAMMPSGSRFSAYSEERQDILSRRKATLIQYHRKRYIASSRGADLRRLYGKDVPNPDSLRQRRTTSS